MPGSVESVVSAKVVDGSGWIGSASTRNAVVMAGERNRDSGGAWMYRTREAVAKQF